MHLHQYIRVVSSTLVICLTIATPGVVRAQSTIKIISDLVAVLTNAQGLVSGIVKDLEEAVNSGIRIYDTIDARVAHQRLIDMYVDLSDLPEVQRQRVLGSIEQYVETPTEENWSTLQSSVQEVLTIVVDLRNELKQEDSRFVAEPAFASLMQTLTARNSLLQKLTQLPPPTQPDELHELMVLHERYQALIEELVKAREALREYLQQQS